MPGAGHRDAGAPLEPDDDGSSSSSSSSSSSASSSSYCSVGSSVETNFAKSPHREFVGSLCIGTWNTAGLCGPNIQEKVKPILKAADFADVLCLQETHDLGHTLDEIFRNHGFTTFSQPGSTNWGGCNILIKNCKFKDALHFSIVEGRAHGVRILDDKGEPTLCILNVHIFDVVLQKKVAILRKCKRFVEANNNTPIVLLGDFNCVSVLEDRQDLQSMEFTGQTDAVTAALHELIELGDFFELFQPDYTRAPYHYDDLGNHTGTAARIDRIYAAGLPFDTLDVYTYCMPLLTVNKRISDHSFVFPKFLKRISRGPPGSPAGSSGTGTSPPPSSDNLSTPTLILAKMPMFGGTIAL